MSDDLERRLSAVLNRVGEQADGVAGRLRNPAESPPPQRARARAGRVRTAWVAGGAAMAMAAVTAGVVLAAPRLGGRPDPAASPSPAASRTAGVPVGTTDGLHPLWPLTLAQTSPRSFNDLPVATSVPVPVPYTLDPRLTPELATVPTLVTAAGTVRFSPREAKTVDLLAERRQGLFVVLNGVGHDGEDGFFDARFVLVAADNSRREIHRAATANGFAVSPDGTWLAVDTGRAVDLVDVASGAVVRRLTGGAGPTWAGDDALLLDRKGVRVVWRAPWTDPPEATPFPVAGSTPLAGVIEIDESTGCARRVGGDGTVNAANCGGWRSGGMRSTEGRFVPLEWRAADGAVRRGVLDVRRNQVRPWPVAGVTDDVSWLGPADVLLKEDVDHGGRKARCRLDTDTCWDVTDAWKRDWRGEQWLGR